MSISVSHSSQKNHRILVKLKKKKDFLGKNLVLNCPKWPCHRLMRNSHIVYNRTIPLHVLDAQFQFLCICCSRLYLEGALRFFVLGPNCAHFGGFWGNKASKQHQTELKFWPQVVLIVVQILLSISENSNFYRDRGCTQSVSFWSIFNPKFTPWRWPKSKLAN